MQVNYFNLTTYNLLTLGEIINIMCKIINDFSSFKINTQFASVKTVKITFNYFSGLLVTNYCLTLEILDFYKMSMVSKLRPEMFRGSDIF